MNGETQPSGTLGGNPGTRAAARGATVLAVAWAAALALLALQWTRTPLSGPGRALLIWSIPAAPLAVFTWAWLRGRAVGRIPLGLGVVAWVAVIWAGVAVTAVLDPGAEWVLDGLILRRPLERFGGLALAWAPGVWGLAVSVAGLAAALEARYQLARAAAPSPEKKSPPSFDGGDSPSI